MKHCIDRLYDLWGEKPSRLSRLRAAIHRLLCPACDNHARRLDLALSSLDDFFPNPPPLEDAVMSRINALPDSPNAAPLAPNDLPSHDIPLKRWLIAGVCMLVSLTTIFFNIDFVNLVRREGSSFLLPFGLVMGLALAVYGSLFVSAHLKEFSDRFGLH